MNTLVERVDRVYEPLEAVGWPAGRPYEPEPIMTVARSVGDVVVEQAAQWRDCGVRYMVLLNSSAFQRSLRKGLAATQPFNKIVRELKRL